MKAIIDKTDLPIYDHLPEGKFTQHGCGRPWRGEDEKVLCDISDIGKSASPVHRVLGLDELGVLRLHPHPPELLVFPIVLHT